MPKKMLIDTTHPEETRVAIMEGRGLEEFEFESTTKKMLKGNIYLAKVVRIEPSLQAAFVEYGGNRHGFLPFSEIHPDYYRIPVEDRETLLREQAEDNKKRQSLDDAPVDEDKEIEVPDAALDVEVTEDLSSGSPTDVIDFSPEEVLVVPASQFSETKEVGKARQQKPYIPLHKRYKIQEVVKRRQIMLIQINKEERGGKGAALTTYLSVAGRYCVLMPNSPNSGGISRKITNVGDRKRLRSVIEEIDLPQSMSLIVRTAGMSRTKPEIKRDCDYLVRLWNDVRDQTLKSEAPALIYEEGDLVKRSIRDYYDKHIDEVLVDGDDGFNAAKGFMKQLMPSHVRRVKAYSDQGVSLFQKFGVEDQVSSIHEPSVQLKSGGYIVFGTTEALVAIDVNSGKSTKERHIDETAYQTNLEAADEVARQLRLRDLAGLVVIDFIDMEDSKHIEAVERRLREAMRGDRARVQLGRISNFGLLELSRQRLRPNIIEATSIPCRHCQGTGMMRSAPSCALQVLRAIEEEAAHKRSKTITISMPVEVSLYILNEKRGAIAEIESQWSVKIIVQHDPTLIVPEFRIEKEGQSQPEGQRRSDAQERKQGQPTSQGGKKEGGRRSRRSPHGKPRTQEQGADQQRTATKAANQDEAAQSEESSLPAEQGERRPRRRGRRRPQRRREGQGEGQPPQQEGKAAALESTPPVKKEESKSHPSKPSPKGEEKASSEAKEKAQSKPETPVTEGTAKKNSGKKNWIKRLLE